MNSKRRKGQMNRNRDWKKCRLKTNERQQVVVGQVEKYADKIIWNLSIVLGKGHPRPFVQDD